MKQHRQLRIATDFVVSAALVLSALALPFPAPASSPPSTVATNEVVGVWLTDLSGGARLSQQPNLSFALDSGFNPVTIAVDENSQFQDMEGFGASFTDSSAWLVFNKLSAPQRNALMTNLFS